MALTLDASSSDQSKAAEALQGLVLVTTLCLVSDEGYDATCNDGQNRISASPRFRGLSCLFDTFALPLAFLSSVDSVESVLCTVT
jgi:hypothetical protein